MVVSGEAISLVYSMRNKNSKKAEEHVEGSFK